MTLKEFLNCFDFDYTKDSNGYHLIDLQGANLGGIESETFETIDSIVDRLDIYYNDYILEYLNDCGFQGDKWSYEEYLDFAGMNGYDFEYQLLNIICMNEKLEEERE